MSTQPKQILYSPVDIDDAEFVDFQEPDPKLEEENLEFEKFRAEMHDAQDDAKIMVGKKLTDSRGRPMGKQVFECFECGIDDYSFSQLCTRIREDFGTGLYQILGRDSNGKYKFRKIVGVQAPFSDSADNIPAGTDVGMLIDKFSDAMQRQQMRTEQMFAKLTGPQNSGDAFEQMTKMMTAMGGVMGAMGISPSQPKSMLDQLTEFKMLKELFGDSDSGGDANLYSLLTATMQSFGAPIAQAIAMGQQTGALDAAGVLTPPALPNPKPETETDAEKEMKANEAMKANILVLVKNAQANTDPAQFAGVLIANLPEDKIDEFYDFISADDYLQRLVSLVPEVEAHKNWFIKLRDTVIELLTEPEDEHTIAPKPDETAVPVAGETDTVISDDTAVEPTADS